LRCAQEADKASKDAQRVAFEVNSKMEQLALESAGNVAQKPGSLLEQMRIRGERAKALKEAELSAQALALANAKVAKQVAKRSNAVQRHESFAIGPQAFLSSPLGLRPVSTKPMPSWIPVRMLTPILWNIVTPPTSLQAWIRSNQDCSSPRHCHVSRPAAATCPPSAFVVHAGVLFGPPQDCGGSTQ